jgi:hypothetical protein
MTSNSPSESPLVVNKEEKNTDKEATEITDKESSFEPSHIMTGDYAALMETNGKECESWYYFIRCEGNMDALNHLQKQLEQVDWYILDDLSTFDLDLEHFVDAKTAKQMTKLELNAYAFHRKFDGKLDEINFNFKKKDLKNNTKMMEKVFDLIGYGQIEDYISDEDLDPEDLTSDTETDTEDDSETESSSEEEEERIKSKMPSSLMKTEIPKWAKAKKKKNKNHK